VLRADGRIAPQRKSRLQNRCAKPPATMKEASWSASKNAQWPRMKLWEAGLWMSITSSSRGAILLLVCCCWVDASRGSEPVQLTAVRVMQTEHGCCTVTTTQQASPLRKQIALVVGGCSSCGGGAKSAPGGPCGGLCGARRCARGEEQWRRRAQRLQLVAGCVKKCRA